MGIEDPQLKLISARQQVFGQIDQSNPESLLQGIKMLGQMGDQQGAMALAEYYRGAQNQMAQTQQRKAAEQASLATTAKTQLSIDQENKLRDELAKLPPDATQEQILSVVTKYGSPDKVLATLQGSADRAAQREQSVQLQRERIDAQIQAAKDRGATQKEIAEMRIQGQKDLAIFAQSLKGPKVLAPGLQKEEDKELELVDSLTARSQALQPALAALTPDPKTKKVPLELGPLNNLRYQAQNAAGNSTPESQKFAELERAVQSATNLKTDAAKGVQTDKDVLRFANELIAAYGKYDTKVTKQALEDFIKSTDKARENAQKRIDSRRRSQGVEAYYGPAAGTAQNPIKLD
jgi:ribosomal protein L3